MLWLTHTLSKPSSMATLARSLTCQDRVFRFSATKIIITTEKRSGHPRLYLVGRFLLCLILWFVTTGLTPKRFSEKYILSFYSVSDAYLASYSLFFWCYLVQSRRRFSAFLQVSLLALISFSSLAL